MVYVQKQDPYIINVFSVNISSLDGRCKMDAKKESPSLVGRERQIEELLKILDDVKDGKGKTVFVSGEPGVGKTSLIERLIEETRKDKFLILKGVCRYDDHSPYGPIKEAWIDSEQEDLKDLISVKKNKDIKDKEMLDAYRNVAFYETAEQVKSISIERPVLFFLDDMHWADQGTINIFHYLADRLQNNPVLLIGTYCPGDAVSGTAFIGMKQMMSRKKLFHKLELEPLDLEDTRSLIKTLTGFDDISEEFVNMVHETTEGNPLFIKEGILQMSHEGIFKKGGEPEIEKFEHPILIEEVVERRINRLDIETRELLQFGAVVGNRVPYILLENISDLDEFDMLNAVDDLIENRLWYEGEHSEDFYFSHNILRDIVYKGIGRWLERKRLHRRVAEAIGKLYKNERHHLLAYHLQMAEDYEKAVKNYIKAGKKAEEVYSHEDAVDMYKEALSLYKNNPHVKVDKIWISERIADAYNLMGRYDESREYLNKAMKEAVEEEEQLRLYRKIAESFSEQGEYDDALSLINEITAPDKDSPEAPRILGIKGWSLMNMGDYPEAKETFEEERFLAEKIGADKEIAQAFHNLGSMSLMLGRYEKALDHLDKAMDIWEETEYIKGLSKSLNNLAGLNSFIGDLDKALEQYNECLDLYREMENIPLEGKVLNNIGVIYYKKGRLEKAANILKKGLDIAKKVGGRSSRCNLLINLGQVYKDLGDEEMAEEYLHRALTESERLDYINGRLFSRSILAQLKIESGELEEAEEYVDKVIEISSEMGVKRDQGIGTYLKGSILREKERWDEAEEKYLEALEIFDKLNALDYKGETLYEYGISCERKGDKERASELIGEALQIFEKRGMDMWVQRCRKRLDEI